MLPGAAGQAVWAGARPSADGYSRNVPRRGRQAAVSLWIAGLPEDCGLTDLEVCFGGARIIPCHIALGIEGVRQVNALRSRNFQVGPVTIGVAYLGHALAQTFELEVIEGDPQRPMIVSVSDGENLALQRKSCSGELKIAVENVKDPNSLRAFLGRLPLAPYEIVAEDPVMAQYQYSLQ